MASHTIAQICGLDSTKNFFAPFVNSSAVINPLSGSDFKSPGLPDVSCSILEFRAVVRARWFFFLSVRFPISRAFPRYSASIASSGFESSQQEWCFSFFAGTGCVHRRLPGGPDFEVDAVPEAYAALALIGGLSWRSDAALGFAPLVEGCRRQGSVLGGICGAAAFLARLGTLNHARYGQRSGRSQKVVRLRLCGRGVLYSKAGRSGQKHRHRKRHGAAGICPRDAYGAGGRAGGENPRWYDFHKLGFYTAPMPKIQKEVEVCPR